MAGDDVDVEQPLCPRPGVTVEPGDALGKLDDAAQVGPSLRRRGSASHSSRSSAMTCTSW